MPIQRLYIGFDHILFDSDRFKSDLASSLWYVGIAPEIFWQTYPLALASQEGKKAYTIAAHAAALSHHTGQREETIQECLMHRIEHADEYVSTNSRDFLSRMVALNVPVTLLSRGSQNHQEEKIRYGRLGQYFTQVHHSPFSKKQMIDTLGVPTEGIIFFVNDHLEETQTIQKTYPHLRCIVKRRPETSLSHYREGGILNFETLDEIKDYLTVFHASSYAKE